ncbi:NifB/NifX family molybdenum-iron cluster-binding protein [Desulfocicer niacini]
MKVAFPTNNENGLNSDVYNHFGSAAFFILLDTDTQTFEILKNQDKDHAHGQCQPLKALGDVKTDAIVVGGIGKGALGKLSAEGVKTYRAMEGTVQANLDLLNEGKLSEFLPGQTCKGHAIGGGCAH